MTALNGHRLILDLSDALDLLSERERATGRTMFARGYDTGWKAGYDACERDMAASWRRVANWVVTSKAAR